MPLTNPCNLCEIILIENDPILNFVNKRVLQLIGFKGEIHLFSSGKDAIEFVLQKFILDENSPKQKVKLMVFVDEDLNDMDSHDLIDLLQEHSSLISYHMVLVIMVPGEKTSEADFLSKQRKGIEVISKPLVGSNLRMLMEKQSILNFRCIEKTTLRR